MVTRLPMHTFTGKEFYALEPNVKDISIVDIAHGLSNVCRYGGMCKEFYSVGQHSIICAWEAPYPLRKKLLLHDASEAYIGDIISPLKMTDQYEIYRQVERRLMEVIYEKFELEEDTQEEAEEIHRIDLLVRHTEMRDFGSLPEEFYINEPVLPYIITPIPPVESKILFLKEFSRLFGYGKDAWRYFR